MEDKIVKIKLSKLKELVESDLKLLALENGGVDNWSYYYESLNEDLGDGKSFNDITDDNDEFNGYVESFIEE